MYVNDQGQSIKNLKTTEKYLIPKSGKVTENLFLDNFVPFSSSIIRKDCFKNAVSSTYHFKWVLIGIYGCAYQLFMSLTS